ncbi:unnamed protein product (mitochondrion) [Plasmodiophora brassicae]|uniref:Leucine-rich repeat-containing N-terminal plant-type domain-containing protein n=1 Tax=Plasmodiophora brassicae TaxID=37360 RepID=A0A3P3YGW4_PLABS|nr:unnamed protein product [Plasmodiophora brassicae]
MCAVCYAVVAVLVLANTQADLCSWYGKGCSGTTIDVSPLNNLTGTIDSTWFATLPTADKAKVLRISNNPGITGIAPGAFSLLTSCTSIDVSQNGVTMIASGVFDPLPELQELTLTKNSINQPLPVLGFPSTLIYLWAGLNHIPSITPGTFDNLTRVDTLWLGGNRLSTLPAHIFDQLTVMTALDLGDNQLQLLPTGVFHSLTSLTTLRLMNNILTYIAPGTFRTLTQLHTLTLRDNSLLVTLDLYLFRNLTSYSPTKTLDLSDTMTALTCVPYPPPITQIYDGSVGTIDEPEPVESAGGAMHVAGYVLALDLGQNQLQRLPVGVFDYLTSLNTLLLWVNLLTTVAPGTFRALTQLQSLTISSNPLLVTLDAYLFQSLSNYDPTATLDVSYSMTDLVCVPTTSGSSSQGTLLHKTSPVIQHFDMPATTPAMHYFNVPATTPAASSMQNFDVPESATSPQTPGSKPGKPSLRHQRRQVARDKFDQGAMTSTVSSDAE